VMDDKPMPSMRELDVTGESYLTGLLDCVGEIKRLVYDRMRSGKGKDAEKLFATMEEIYNAIYPFAVYDNIVSGLRRKLDVARMLIEDIRATVTEESRRKALIEAVGGFERMMTSKEE
jgi:translin